MTSVGERKGRHTHLVRADNPSAMTLEGTNTWIMTGKKRCVIVDPGPDVNGHLDDILHTCQRLGTTIAGILLTHDHADHAEGAEALAGSANAPVLSARTGSLVAGDLTLSGSDGPSLQVVELPGHSSDSVGIIFGEDSVIATGDIIFDRGSAMIYWPDGSLGDYFSTLKRLCSLVADLGLTLLLPGHGETITDPLSQLTRYREHRLERLEQLRSAITITGPDPDAIVRQVYGDVGPDLQDAARRTVLAQLHYLGF